MPNQAKLWQSWSKFTWFGAARHDLWNGPNIFAALKVYRFDSSFAFIDTWIDLTHCLHKCFIALLFCLRSIHWGTKQPKSVLSVLFPFEWFEHNQACHINSRMYELYRIALSVAQSKERAYRCGVFEEVTGACRESMEWDKFARSCSRLDVLNEIWRPLNGKWSQIDPWPFGKCII